MSEKRIQDWADKRDGEDGEWIEKRGRNGESPLQS